MKMTVTTRKTLPTLVPNTKNVRVEHWYFAEKYLVFLNNIMETTKKSPSLDNIGLSELSHNEISKKFGKHSKYSYIMYIFFVSLIRTPNLLSQTRSFIRAPE